VKIPSSPSGPGDAALLARVSQALRPRDEPGDQGLRSDALAANRRWRWPGNVRELENRVKRAVIMADGKLITAADLDLAPGRSGGRAAQPQERARAADRKVIRHALARSEGNISNTARLLGISRPTLYDLLKQYDLHA
jgi:two-component system NtrC family response regulator